MSEPIISRRPVILPFGGPTDCAHLPLYLTPFSLPYTFPFLCEPCLAFSELHLWKSRSCCSCAILDMFSLVPYVPLTQNSGRSSLRSTFLPLFHLFDFCPCITNIPLKIFFPPLCCNTVGNSSKKSFHLVIPLPFQIFEKVLCSEAFFSIARRRVSVFSSIASWRLSPLPLRLSVFLET